MYKVIIQIHGYPNGKIASSLEALSSGDLRKFINHRLRKHVTLGRPISVVLEWKQSSPAEKPA